MNKYAALELTAIAAVRSGSGDNSDYFWRHICRWYSETFATPLHQVMDLPEEFILQHFFECRYEKLESEPDGDQRIDEQVAKLTETLAESFEQALASGVGTTRDEKLFQEEEEMARKAYAEAAKKKPEIPKLDPAQLYKPVAEPSIPDAPVVLPDIKMKFVADDDLDQLIKNLDSQNAPKPK